jgi:hypothetical protein
VGAYLLEKVSLVLTLFSKVLGVKDFIKAVGLFSKFWTKVDFLISFGIFLFLLPFFYRYEPAL